MVFGALKAQASSGVLRTNWSSWASFPSSGRLFWPLYARSWHVAWIGGSRVAVHARAGIDFVRLRLPPCSSAPTSARCPVPCVRTVPCVRGSARGGPGAASPLRGGPGSSSPPVPGPGRSSARRRREGAAPHGRARALLSPGRALHNGGRARPGKAPGARGGGGGLRCASRGRAAPLLRRLLPNSAGRVQLSFADGRWRTDQLTNQPGGFKKA